MNSLDPAGWLVFLRAHSGRVGISPEAAADMSQFIQDEPYKTEAGGILLGRRLVDCADIAVDFVTLPQPGDRRRRKSFVRNSKGHQEAVDLAFDESGGTCVYLGEWHTHPEAIPSPSRTDRRDWNRRLRADPHGDDFFFIILGTEKLVVWEGSGDNHKPVRLKGYSCSEKRDE